MQVASIAPLEEQDTADVEEDLRHGRITEAGARSDSYPAQLRHRLSSLVFASPSFRDWDLYTSLLQACLLSADIMARPMLELRVDTHTYAARPRYPQLCSR